MLNQGEDYEGWFSQIFLKIIYYLIASECPIEFVLSFGISVDSLTFYGD